MVGNWLYRVDLGLQLVNGLALAHRTPNWLLKGEVLPKYTISPQIGWMAVQIENLKEIALDGQRPYFRAF